MKRILSFIVALMLVLPLSAVAAEAEEDRQLPLGIRTDRAISLKKKKAITKSPTGETVEEGGRAQFVARADNCSGVIWHLSSPEGTDLLAQNAPNSFPGLEIQGLGSERLVLDKIPAGLDGWNVWAEFIYMDGNLISGFAKLHVISKNLAPPTILSHPNSVNLDEGQTITLQVAAQTEEQGLSLKYQWYSNTKNSSSKGKSIPDADKSSYTPEYIPGTTYYYCAIRTTNGNSVSSAAKTKCAAVSYPTLATQPTQAATEPTQTQPTQQATEPTAAQSTQQAPEPTIAQNTQQTVQTAPTQSLAEQPSTAATLADWNAGTVPSEQTLPAVTAAPTVPGSRDAGSGSLILLLAVVIALILMIIIVIVLVIVKMEAEKSRKKRKKTAASQKGQKRADPPRQTITRDPRWDDLSDLDLSYYLGDEDDLS